MTVIPWGSQHSRDVPLAAPQASHHQLEESQQSLKPTELQTEIRTGHNLKHDNDAQHALKQLCVGVINTCHCELQP